MAKLTARATMAEAQTFLEERRAAVPYTIHTLFTDNGIHFADTTKNRTGSTTLLRGHPFDRMSPIGNRTSIDQAQSPLDEWTSGADESVKEATVNRSFYQTYAQLQEHLSAFVNAYNFAKRLKTVQGLIPYELSVRTWAEKPELFHADPLHLTSGLYT